MTQRNRFAMFVCLFLALIGAAGLIGAWGAYLTDSRLLASGPRTQGVVLHKNTLRASDGDSDHIVSYRFVTAAGQQIETQRHVSKELWSRLEPGVTVEVIYSASDPKRNFPDGTGVTSLTTTIIVSLLCGAMIAVGVSALLGMRKRAP